jgi:hypothetical protein
MSVTVTTPSGQSLVFDPATNTWIITSGTATTGQLTIDPIIFSGIDFGIEPEKKNYSDGCHCKKCKDYFPYAEPNQEDGSMVCYACRHGL